MQPKLLKNDVAEFIPGEFDGQNHSGIRAIGEMVLVLPDAVAEKTAGGIHLPEEIRERQALAAETGAIVDIGEGAFLWNADKTRPWSGYKPVIGDRVYIQRYSGMVFPGDDGQKYRILEYTCIGAVREGPVG